MNIWKATEIEPFVDADAVAEFLSLKKREVLKLTRRGIITGCPISGTLRKTYKYRLSVIADEMAAITKSAGRAHLTSNTRVSSPGPERYA